MTEDQKKQIEVLIKTGEKATQRDWKLLNNSDRGIHWIEDQNGEYVCDFYVSDKSTLFRCDPFTNAEANALFSVAAANAREAVKAMAAENERLRKALEQLMDDISGGTMKLRKTPDGIGIGVCVEAWELAEKALQQGSAE